MPDRTLILSATNTLARGFLAVPTDRPFNALFAVARAVTKAFAFKLPARAVAVIDTAAPKAGWPALLAAQLPRLAPLLETLGVHVVRADGELHVVASYARAALDAGDDVVIVGIDKRFAQLVGDRLWWYDANKDARYTHEMVVKRFGVPPAHVAEWLGLVGDEDELPGIAGIGAKGATGLLQTYGTVAAALDAVESIAGRAGNAIRAARELIPAELARARLERDRPLPAALDAIAFHAPAAAPLNELYRELKFAELLSADGGEAIDVTVCETDDAVRAALASLGAGPIAVHALTEDPSPVRGALAGLALSAGDRRAYYMPFRPCEPLVAWLGDPAIAKIGHDLKVAVVALRRHRIELAGIAGDSMCASHLAQPSNWAPHDLSLVAKHVLGRALPAEDAVRGVGRQRKPWGTVDGTAPPFGGAAGRAQGPTVDGTAPPFGGAAGRAQGPTVDGTAPPFGGAAGRAQGPTVDGTAPPFGGAAGRAQGPTVDGTAPPFGGAAGRAQGPTVDGTAPPFGGAAGRAQGPTVDGTAPPFGGAAGRAQGPTVDGLRAADFAGRYAEAAANVWRTLEPTLDKERHAEYLALSETLVRMELHGIGVDRDELGRAEAAFAPIEAELEREITALAGHELNLGSSKQLGELLFAELKLPVVSHTKTGWSTATEALERIEHAHPIVPLVIRWRTLRRLRDSWITALRACVDVTAPPSGGADGRVHSCFHPARSFSGHIVNSNPDLGRVPGRTPEMARIRRAFVARPGHVLMSVDYNQLGLHVLAHLTKDPALIEPLRDHADVHAQTAAAVLERAPDAITPDDRQLGKVVNFATFAGQGASALALQLGIAAAEAKELIARFDRKYSRVREFQDEQLRLARERGYIVTIAGRHWPIGGLESLDPQDRSYAERLARRATHEGSVSDVSRRGLLDADRALRAAGLGAVPLVQILDEVLFEVPVAEVADAARVAGDAMRTCFTLEAPLRIGVEVGPNWADLKPL